MTLNDERKPRKRILFLYGLYALAVVLFLLYSRFPSEAVRDYVEAGFRNRVAAVDVKIGAVEPALPPGLVLNDFRVIQRDMPKMVLFSASDVKVSPETGKILRGIPAAKILCRTYGGEVSGRVSLSERRLKGDVTLDLELRGIKLEENLVLQQVLGRRIHGMLEGIVSFNGQPGNAHAGEGQIRFVAKDGSVQVDEAFLGLDILEFSRVLLSGDLMNGKFNLVNGDIEGPDYRGSITGTVFLEPDFPGSRLDLQGWIEIFPSFFTRKDASSSLKFLRQRLKRGKLNFSVEGTISGPVVKFI
ncbi:MAG TPA: type II secretion system protein GspN [Desulfobacteraceae bacterium]|jgi:type II secretion system protein N|nr:type II secretion system protein GspN [Desulfobacteraceae bacterium]